VIWPLLAVDELPSMVSGWLATPVSGALMTAVGGCWVAWIWIVCVAVALLPLLAVTVRLTVYCPGWAY
jgi:hypothetical protein